MRTTCEYRRVVQAHAEDDAILSVDVAQRPAPLRVIWSVVVVAVLLASGDARWAVV
jgi:hypothetical protein